MRYSIWGYNKWGEAKCFALYVAPEDETEYLERAKREGWTGLKVDRAPQPQLFSDPEIQESASSEKAKSRRTKKALSGSSEDA
jgi:hypothetical protein